MLDWDEHCSESQSNFSSQLRATEQNKVSNPRSHRRSPLRCLRKSEIQTRHCGCAERDDVTDRDIQHGAQWPVCRSWCQCHPTLRRSIPLAGGLLPRSRRAWKISAISAGRCSVSTSGSLRRYHSQFDRHIRADRRNFKSVNECGREQADRHPRSYVVRFRRSSLPGNHLRRDLDSPAAATATRYMTFFRAQRLRRTWYMIP